MDRGLAQDILDYQDWLGFSIRRDRVTLEANLPHNESLSLGVCHRFYGKEGELDEAIKRGNRVIKGLLTLEKDNGDISRRYLYLFYALVGNMYYFKGDFKLAIGYFMKVLDYEREDLTAWVELLFSLRAMGEFELFEDGRFNIERLYNGWRESKEKEMGKETLIKLMKCKQKHVLGKVEITSRCNQNCLFCPVSHTEKDLPFSEIIKRMTELKESGATEVMFSGGEPTLRTDLPQLIKKAYEMGFIEVCIQTNGSGLYDEELLKSYLKEGPVKFDISFHTHRKEIFERISGGKGSFERFLEGMENIRKHKAFAYFTVVISSLNYKELKEQIEFAEENFPDVRHFSFNFVDPNGNALENKWIVPKLSEAEPYMKEAFSYILSKGMTFRIEFVPLCFLEGFEEYSSEAQRNREIEESIFSSINSDGEVRVRNNLYMKSKFCDECKFNLVCPGLNRRYVDIYGIKDITRWIEPNLRSMIYPYLSEWVGLKEGFKKAAIFYPTKERLQAFLKMITLMGYKYELSGFYFDDADKNLGINVNSLTDNSHTPVYVSRDELSCGELKLLDSNLLRNKVSKEDIPSYLRRIGKLLGYPECCIEFICSSYHENSRFYNDLVENMKDYELVHRYLALRKSDTVSHLLNNFDKSIPPLIPFFVCNYNCENARKIAERTIRNELYHLINPQIVESKLKRPILFLSIDEVISFSRVSQNNNGIIEYYDAEVYAPFEYDRLDLFKRGDSFKIFEDNVTIYKKGLAIGKLNRGSNIPCLFVEFD